MYIHNGFKGIFVRQQIKKVALLASYLNLSDNILKQSQFNTVILKQEKVDWGGDDLNPRPQSASQLI
jgi:hypothetical protein